VVLDVAIVPIWAVAAAKVKKTLKGKQVPLMALGAAFAFIIMLFNVPVVGGTTAHAVGATLIAIIPQAECGRHRPIPERIACVSCSAVSFGRFTSTSANSVR